MENSPWLTQSGGTTKFWITHTVDFNNVVGLANMLLEESSEPVDRELW